MIAGDRETRRSLDLSAVGAAKRAKLETTTTTTTSSTPTPQTHNCTGETRPFTVGGTSICVPAKLYPAQSVAHCVLDETWEELSRGRDEFFTGGLGKDLVAYEWEVWWCGSNVPCMVGKGDLVCFTYSEVHDVFVPWGHNTDLSLVKKT